MIASRSAACKGPPSKLPRMGLRNVRDSTTRRFLLTTKNWDPFNSYMMGVAIELHFPHIISDHIRSDVPPIRAWSISPNAWICCNMPACRRWASPKDQGLVVAGLPQQTKLQWKLWGSASEMGNGPTKGGCLDMRISKWSRLLTYDQGRLCFLDIDIWRLPNMVLLREYLKQLISSSLCQATCESRRGSDALLPPASCPPPGSAALERLTVAAVAEGHCEWVTVEHWIFFCIYYICIHAHVVFVDAELVWLTTNYFQLLHGRLCDSLLAFFKSIKMVKISG